MAGKPYKPERPVTSEKIRLAIEAKFNERWKNDRYAPARAWKRISKHRLPESKGWVRGYEAHGTGPSSGAHVYHAIALSNMEDTELLKVYLCEDWKTESQSLGVIEVMFKDD